MLKELFGQLMKWNIIEEGRKEERPQGKLKLLREGQRKLAQHLPYNGIITFSSLCLWNNIISKNCEHF